MHVTNKQLLDKLNNDRKQNLNDRFIAIFSHSTSIILLCGRNNLKSFSFILFKFVLRVINKVFSDKFNNGWKNIQMADLLRFFAFYVNNLTLWAR